ncbi:hypothetical protein Q6375_00310 [Clostridium septicum]|uniref:hypothetical protein n=1 Tax=Clostridium septicum TaxID=1504 RepID=UPI00272E0C9E|nr:hypothetical protein [Clostridium septicum]WLF69508.1 hypothetical protein Q6375_00310 [Clostridium septicum]
MLENFVSTVVPIGIHLLEAMGIVIVIIGAIKAFYKYTLNLLAKKKLFNKNRVC